MELHIDRLHNLAVNAAIAKKWSEAIELNKKILVIDEENIDALLAISYAYLESHDLKQAKKYYRSVTKLDPTNVIARNNLDKINILLKKGHKPGTLDDNDIELHTDTFISIKGKTRVVTLMNSGQSSVIAKLKIGEKVYLKGKKRRLEVRTKQGDYVGCLPDDVSKRLSFFLEAGSVYTILIKSATRSSVDIFVREESKGDKVANFVSFPENIQDDMKKFIGKEDDTDGEEDSADGENESESGEDDVVDDIERLAEDDDSEPDEYFGIDTTENEDEDE